MTRVNNIPVTIWAGLLAAAVSSLGVPPVTKTPDNNLVAVVAVPCKFPKRKRIRIKDEGIKPKNFGKIVQATGKQKWNKNKR
jgi:heterodisulfide reductase subunit B